MLQVMAFTVISYNLYWCYICSIFKKCILIADLHWLREVFWLKVINIHSEYKFQINQPSLYAIDFVQQQLWKELDYLYAIRQNKQKKQSEMS